MSCFSADAQHLFEKWKKSDLLAELEDLYQGLLDRRKEAVEYGDPEQISPRERARLNLALLQQVQLHRAVRLFASINSLVLDHNVYGLALIVRGFYETTAIVGYFCDRLEALAKGNIEFETFEWNVADAVMGARHEQFQEARRPPNILTCIEKADRYIDAHLLGEKKGILQDCYNWLSDFAHPNFLSNVSAFSLDKKEMRFVLKHDDALSQQDFDMVEYLALCAGLFIPLYEALSERAADGCLDE